MAIDFKQSVKFFIGIFYSKRSKTSNYPFMCGFLTKSKILSIMGAREKDQEVREILFFLSDFYGESTHVANERNAFPFHLSRRSDAKRNRYKYQAEFNVVFTVPQEDPFKNDMDLLLKGAKYVSVKKNNTPTS